MIESEHLLRKGGSPLLLVVEGFNDIEFLRRISRILHAHDASLPDLGESEEQGRIVFVPFGGGGVLSWTDRLAPLGLREWHLYDREACCCSAYQEPVKARSPRRSGMRRGDRR